MKRMITTILLLLLFVPLFSQNRTFTENLGEKIPLDTSKCFTRSLTSIKLLFISFVFVN